MKNLYFIAATLFVAISAYSQSGSFSGQIINSEVVEKRIDKIATDNNNNTFIAGRFATTITLGNTTLSNPSPYSGGIPPAVFVAKMGTNNSIVWAKGFLPMVTSAGNSAINIYGLISDAGGNVYATGDFLNRVSFAGTVLNSTKNGPDPRWNIFTIKMTPSGAVSWITQEGNSFKVCGAGDSGRSVAVDNAGNVVVTGSSVYTVFNNTTSCSSCPNETSRVVPCVYVVKYNSIGKKGWEQKYFDSSATPSGPCPGAMSGTNVRSDGTNFFITGNMHGMVAFGNTTLNTGSQSTGNVFLLKLNVNGQPVFAKSISGTNNASFLVGEGQCFLNNSDIYVSGSFYENGLISSGGCSLTYDSLHTYLFKFNSTGVCQWSKTYQGIVYGAVTNQSGNIEMLQRLAGNAGAMTFGIREISPSDGNTLSWLTEIQDVPNPTLDYWSGPVKTSTGYAFCQNLHGTYSLDGYQISSVGSGYEDLIIVRKNTSASPAYLLSTSAEISDEGVVLYPNPSTNEIYIQRRENEILGHVMIYDALGRIVYERNIEEVKARIDITQLASGIYYVRLDQVSPVAFIRN